MKARTSSPAPTTGSANSSRTASIAPIDLGADADLYADVAIEAFTYDGALYGVPYAIENIALVRNVDLVPEAPATFEDLEATALALQADGTVDVPLAVQQDPG